MIKSYVVACFFSSALGASFFVSFFFLSTLFASISDKDPINLISPELLGSSVVTVSGEFVGKLVEMISLPNHEVYVISNNDKEVLIPVIPEFVHSVDISEKVISISPVDGLLV